MAIDTVGLVSPFLDEDTATRLEQECMVRQGIEMKTGELVYCITTGSLEGSFDSRISICVKREVWVSAGGAPFKVPSEPYLYIEGSVHKALLGHNVYGGPSDFQMACRYMIALCERLIDMPLPNWKEWRVKRVDVAEVYELPSFEAVQEYFRGLTAADYPRRSVHRYGLSGVYASGSSTSLKFYHKGPEFAKHDRSRLRKLWDAKDIVELHEVANKILRVEVEIKQRKLEYDFGKLPYIIEVSGEYLDQVYDTEVQRFLREGGAEMEVVRDAVAVERRLRHVYGARLGGVLLGFWYKLATLGEDYAKKNMPRATFYRQRKQLVDAGCSWHGTDVTLREYTLIPFGFAPVRTDSRRLVCEHPLISKKFSEVLGQAEDVAS